MKPSDGRDEAFRPYYLAPYLEPSFPSIASLRCTHSAIEKDNPHSTRYRGTLMGPHKMAANEPSFVFMWRNVCSLYFLPNSVIHTPPVTSSNVVTTCSLRWPAV